jgi:single-strand DNA-binding protein
MNKVILIGNLTKDPEMKTTTSGTSVTNFTLAVQRRFKNAQGEREVDFLNCVAWKATAEIIAKYASKGNKVAVVGSIQTRTYEAQDKTKRYVTEVMVEEVTLLTPKSDASSGDSKQQPVKQQNKSDYDSMADMQEIDEDMPF